MAEATIESAERKREYTRRYMRLRRKDPAYLAKHREYNRRYMRLRRTDPAYLAEKQEYMRKYDAARQWARKSRSTEHDNSTSSDAERAYS